MKRVLICIVLALTLGAGCSGKRDPKDLLGPNGGGTIVVDARLIVGSAMPVIRLTTTQSPDQPYHSLQAILRDADVILTTTAGDTIWYGDFGEDNYNAVDATAGVENRVLPRTTYQLHVTTADGRVVRAQSTTPDTFHVREWLLVDSGTLQVKRSLATPQFRGDYVYPSDSVFFAPSNQLIYQDGLVEARFDRGTALAFQMALFNIEHDSPLLFDADFLSDEDKARLDRQTSSPPLDAPDGFVRLPWLAVWYEGRHRFAVYSVDRNWYDLVRSMRFYGPTGLGFGSNAGDQFDKPIFHIEGGIGLFGSAAMDWTGFTVHPRP